MSESETYRPDAGRLPPCDMDAETSTLGAVLLADVALDAILELGLLAEHFYRPRHRLVYGAMVRLRETDRTVDAVTVCDELRRHGELEEAGDLAYVHSLPSLVPAAGNVRHYAAIVRELARRREVLAAARELEDQAYGSPDSARELIERAEERLFRLADPEGGELRPIDEVLTEELDRLEAASRGGGVIGVRTGFRDLDELTGGLRPGNLIVVAARPSMGKSALVANVADHAAREQGLTTALFSLEMSAAEVAQRLIACRARLNGEDLRRGRVRADAWAKVVRAAEEVAAAPLFVDDRAGLSLLDLRAKARRLARKGVGLILVDYLQLMAPANPGDSRVQQVGQLSRGLKQLARECDCPVIAVSQLSRAVEQRPDKRPQLSDLRDSGEIEQDADLVMFLYRDEYYHRDSERPGEADVIVAKHRSGPTGDVALAFVAKHPTFRDLARVPEC